MRPRYLQFLLMPIKLITKIELINQDQLTWSQFSINMVGVHFHNSNHDNRNLGKLWQLNKENSYLKQNPSLLEKNKITINQILSSKLCYIGQVYTILKCIWKKNNEKRTSNFLSTMDQQNITPSRHLAGYFRQIFKIIL